MPRLSALAAGTRGLVHRAMRCGAHAAVPRSLIHRAFASCRNAPCRASPPPRFTPAKLLQHASAVLKLPWMSVLAANTTTLGAGFAAAPPALRSANDAKTTTGKRFMSPLPVPVLDVPERPRRPAIRPHPQ